MIIVQGWVRLSAGEGERLRPAAVAMMEASRAEAGCLKYAYAADLAEPDRLHVVERWADQAALDAHFASAHMAAFNAAFAGASIVEAQVEAYAADEGRVIMQV